MASLPESSTSERLGQSYPPGQSQLERLPTEVLTMVVGELCQNELQSYLHLQNQDRVEASRSADQNMRNLCLTSRRIDSIARSLLFRTITVSSPEKLLLLYAALRENPQLGQHIRQISFEILLKRVEPDDFFPLPSRAPDILSASWDEPIRPLSRKEYSAYYCDQLLSSSYFEVLRRAPHIQHLVLRIQEVAFHYPGDRERDLTFTYEPFFRKIQSASVGTGFLPRLKTLRVLGDPENPGKMVLYDLCAPLFRNHALETIALTQVGALFGDPEISRSQESDRAFKTVKVADLQACLCVDREFRELGYVLPNLESLRLSIMMDDMYNSYGPPGTRGHHRLQDLQGSLAQMKGLRTLVLELSHSCKAIDMADVPAEGLSLASLMSLEVVKMPLLFLAGKDSTTSEGLESRLHRALPRFLTHLTVIVEVGCLRYWYGKVPGSIEVSSPTSTSVSTVIALMEALSQLGREAFPHLEEVVCCYSMRGYRRRQQLEMAGAISTDLEEAVLFGLDDDSSKRLEKLRRSVQLQSIRFGVAYEEVYAHIQSPDAASWA